jgi:hypothetical protein
MLAHELRRLLQAWADGEDDCKRLRATVPWFESHPLRQLFPILSNDFRVAILKPVTQS